MTTAAISEDDMPALAKEAVNHLVGRELIILELSAVS